jgi:lactoylglutathione lyase
MNTSILGLRTTIYKVSDLARAKAWYAKAFQTAPYFDESFYVGFNIGGYELGLQPEASVKGDNVVSFWGVTDIEAEYQRFVALGAISVEKPMNVGGKVMVATIKDPWNNLVGLIYNPDFKTGC